MGTNGLELLLCINAKSPDTDYLICMSFEIQSLWHAQHMYAHMFRSIYELLYTLAVYVVY